MKRFHGVAATLVLIGFLVLPSPRELLGQTLQENLEKLAEDAARGYISPIVDGFGADLNAGWYHRVPKGTKFSINVEFGLVAMGAFFSEEHRRFSTSSGSFNFDRATANDMIPPMILDPLRSSLIDQLIDIPLSVTISGPTVVGSEDEQIQVAFSGGSVTFRSLTTGADTAIGLSPASELLPVGGLIDFSLLPFAAPQLSVGTVYGTALTVRYLPSIKLTDEIGKLKYFGIGVQHNPSVWFPRRLVFDFSIGVFYQKLTLGNLFEANATHVGVQASKTFGPGLLSITPYVGLGWETSDMKFTYTFSSTDGSVVLPIEFELEAENNTRLTAGVSLRLGIININADYNLGNTKTASVGLMLAI